MIEDWHYKKEKMCKLMSDQKEKLLYLCKKHKAEKDGKFGTLLLLNLGMRN